MFFCLLPALSSESSSESDSSNLTSTLDPTTKEHLLMEATAAAFLILYQYNKLEVQVNDSKVWELRCPHGCWIKSSIRSHVKLSSRGQFMALEQHYGVQGKENIPGPDGSSAVTQKWKANAQKFSSAALVSKRVRHG